MTMFEIDCSDISGIIKESLKVENTLKTVSSIFHNERYLDKVDYTPYFQRNYVWDKAKGTYFIESVLLGTEIPPIVLFADGKALEVIDGRQRFETLLRFVNDELALKADGLHVLTDLEGAKYSELEPGIRDKFDDTKIRILQFGVVNEPQMNPKQKEKIKKEIFNRYNSGIMPLKRAEIERAEYNHDRMSNALFEMLASDSQVFGRSEKLFIAPRKRKGERRDRLNELVSRLRVLLALPHVPIRSYAYGKNKAGIVRAFFERCYEGEDTDVLVSRYCECAEWVERLTGELALLNSPYAGNLLLHDVFFWGFFLMLQIGERLSADDFRKLAERIDFADIAKEPDLWIGVPADYQTTERVFSQNGSHYDKAIVGRYTFAANCLQGLSGVDFALALKNPERFSSVMRSRESLRQFEDFRISKSDPHTETIYDILREMKQLRFEVRPAYQRSEVVQTKTSSYLMESIMLDIRIPPIFICRRSDGVSEVVDGQQRLLSILGFLGEQYLDDSGEMVYSRKNKFKLKGLRILDELNGMSVDAVKEAHPEYFDKILDFGIDVIEINMEQNERFSPLDLFLRLNHKPCPIKPNSFELWNSYFDRGMIEGVKRLVKEHPGNLFKASDVRMKNEELVMILGYAAYRAASQGKSASDAFAVFVRNGRMAVRVRDKNAVTKMLSEASANDVPGFMSALAEVESFLRKLEQLTGEGFVGMRGLLHFDKGETVRASNQDVYILWILLSSISEIEIRERDSAIRADLRAFFLRISNMEPDADAWAVIREWNKKTA